METNFKKWELSKHQKAVLKMNYQLGLVLMTPGICAAVVALTAMIMYRP